MALGETGQTVETPEWLTTTILKKDYLFGLPLLATEMGTTMDPDTLARYINRSVAVFERELHTKFKPQKVRCNADARGLAKGTDYTIDEEPYDWRPEDYGQGNIMVRLRNTPVKKVLKVELHVPNGDKVVEYPSQWLHLDRKRGTLQIVPWGTNAALTFPYSGYPLFNAGWSQVMPGALWIDYDAGVDTPEDDITDYMAKFAAIMALDVAGDAFMPGVSSYSIGLDGLSESLSQTASPSFAAFGARRKLYADEIAAWYRGVREEMKGIRFTVL